MMRLAKVLQVHPGQRTVDLFMGDTGERISNVQVVGSAGSDTGTWDVPSVPKATSEADAGRQLNTGRNLTAVCAPCAGGRVIVMGFIAPLDNQVGFTEDDRTVHRHASGAYTTIAPDGSMELYHPSGAYLRIGTGAHQNLAAVSATGNWKEVATVAEPTITLSTASCSLTILPDNAGITLAAPNAPMVITVHSLAVNGPVTFNGPVTMNDDATINGDEWLNHRHTQVQSGSAISGPVETGT